MNTSTNNNIENLAKTELLSAVKDIHSLQNQLKDYQNNDDITDILSEQKIEVERLMGMLKMGKFNSKKDVEKLTVEVAALRQALQSTITSLTEENNTSDITGTETISEGVESMVEDKSLVVEEEGDNNKTRIITVNLPILKAGKKKKKKNKGDIDKVRKVVLGQQQQNK